MSIKQCVRCKQKDDTDFSTCRHCGTRYDAKPVATGSKKRFRLLGPELVLAFITVLCIRDS